VPRAEHRGLTIDDYVADLLPDCIEQVRATSAVEDVTMLGYCLGGIFTTLYAALEPAGPLKNLLLIATPINGEGMELQRALLTGQGLDPDLIVDTFGNVPASMIEGAFQILRPLQKASGQLSLLNNASDPDFVKAHLRIVRWGADALPFPGEAFRRLAHDFVKGNKIVRGEFEVRGRKLKLGSIKVPVLHVLAEHDHVVPAAASRDLVRLVGSADKDEWVIKGGHVSLVAGVRRGHAHMAAHRRLARDAVGVAAERRVQGHGARFLPKEPAQKISNKPAAPMPPAMHIVTTA
jgi:polyhydroxyalkanoate synthase